MGGTHLDVEAAVGLSALGLHQEHAVDGFVSVQGYGGSVPEHGNAFHLLYGKAVDRTLNAIHQDKDIPFAGGLDSADVEGSTPIFLALETGVLKGGEAQQFAVEGIGQGDGRGASQLFGGNGIGCRRG